MGFGGTCCVTWTSETVVVLTAALVGPLGTTHGCCRPLLSPECRASTIDDTDAGQQRIDLTDVAESEATDQPAHTAPNRRPRSVTTAVGTPPVTDA